VLLLDLLPDVCPEGRRGSDHPVSAVWFWPERRPELAWPVRLALLQVHLLLFWLELPFAWQFSPVQPFPVRLRVLLLPQQFLCGPLRQDLQLRV